MARHIVLPSTVPVAVRFFDQLPDTAHVDVKVVATLFDVQPDSIWRWARSGRLPKPIKVGLNSTRWQVGELRASIAAMKAEAAA